MKEEQKNLPRLFITGRKDLFQGGSQDLYGKRIAPLHMPIRENEKFIGYVNSIKQKARKYIDKDKKEEKPSQPFAIPAFKLTDLPDKDKQ